MPASDWIDLDDVKRVCRHASTSAIGFLAFCLGYVAIHLLAKGLAWAGAGFDEYFLQALKFIDEGMILFFFCFLCYGFIREFASSAKRHQIVGIVWLCGLVFHRA